MTRLGLLLEKHAGQQFQDHLSPFHQNGGPPKPRPLLTSRSFSPQRVSSVKRPHQTVHLSRPLHPRLYFFTSSGCALPSEGTGQRAARLCIAQVFEVRPLTAWRQQPR